LDHVLYQGRGWKLLKILAKIGCMEFIWPHVPITSQVSAF